VSHHSTTFTIVPLSQDLSASDSVSFEDSEYDDTVSFSGFWRLLHLLSDLERKPSVKRNVGASFDDLESLTNEGLTISFPMVSFLLPEFSFPAGSTTYFLEQLGDTKLSSLSNFPVTNDESFRISIDDESNGITNDES
jgi:hypothetical protein